MDVDGKGFQFTNLSDGVDFDIDGDGAIDHISWTAPSSTNAWLALDRNSNGKIDNGTELLATSRYRQRLLRERNAMAF